MNASSGNFMAKYVDVLLSGIRSRLPDVIRFGTGLAMRLKSYMPAWELSDITRLTGIFLT